MSGDPNRGVPTPTVRPPGFGVYLHVEEGGEPLPQVGLGVTAQIPAGTHGDSAHPTSGVCAYGVGGTRYGLGWGCPFGSCPGGARGLAAMWQVTNCWCCH